MADTPLDAATDASMDISPGSTPHPASAAASPAPTTATIAAVVEVDPTSPEPVRDKGKGKATPKKVTLKVSPAKRRASGLKRKAHEEEEGVEDGEVEDSEVDVSVVEVSEDEDSGASAADDDDDVEDEDEDDGPPSKKRAKTVSGKNRQRKAPKNKIASARGIARTFEECSEADKTILRLKKAGKNWDEIRQAYQKVTGERTGTSTIPNRYARLVGNLVAIRAEDHERLLQAKIEVENAYQKEKWGLVGLAMHKAGASEVYKGDVLQKQYKKLMLERDMGPPEGVKSADFEGVEEEEED
ncbi:hypothetical protein LTR53_001382 [Teratosphaeriaceae sp. CCFEE 6253]|nr:hypothetical protein LTR53_001382 [Teratosphaeriaceae sp. CCFEE 6253]